MLLLESWKIIDFPNQVHLKFGQSWCLLNYFFVHFKISIYKIHCASNYSTWWLLWTCHLLLTPLYVFLVMASSIRNFGHFSIYILNQICVWTEVLILDIFAFFSRYKWICFQRRILFYSVWYKHKQILTIDLADKRSNLNSEDYLWEPSPSLSISS